MGCTCSKCGSNKYRVIEFENSRTGESIDICEVCLNYIWKE